MNVLIGPGRYQREKTYMDFEEYIRADSWMDYFIETCDKAIEDPTVDDNKRIQILLERHDAIITDTRELFLYADGKFSCQRLFCLLISRQLISDTKGLILYNTKNKHHLPSRSCTERWRRRLLERKRRARMKAGMESI